MRNSIAEKKKYLKSYSILDYQYNRLITKAIEWKEKVNSISAVNHNNMGIKGSGYVNPIDLYLDNQEQCLRQAIEIKGRMDRIEKAIHDLNEPILSSILELYYMDGLDFYDISKELKYSISHTRHLHTEALELFEIPKDG